MRTKESKIKILLLEDDSFQSEETAAHLRQIFSGPVDLLKTEFEFVDQLSRIAGDPPDIFILDINLRWANPSPVIPEPPQNVADEGRFLAGYRCCELLAGRNETRNIPVILYSIVDRSHYENRLRKLPEWVVYVPKDNLPLLCETIRQLTIKNKKVERADTRS